MLSKWYRHVPLVVLLGLLLTLGTWGCKDDEQKDHASADTEAGASKSAKSDKGSKKTPLTKKKNKPKNHKKKSATKHAKHKGDDGATKKSGDEGEKGVEAAKVEAGKKDLTKGAEGKQVPFEPPTVEDDGGEDPAGTSPEFVLAALDIDGLLTIKEIESVLGKKKLKIVGPLVGIEPTPTYNSKHFAPANEASFGVAVQVWRFDSVRDLSKRYRAMESGYQNVQKNASITPKTFFAHRGSIFHLVYLDKKRKVIVAVSCDESLCSMQSLFELAKIPHGNLGSLAP